MLLAPLVGGLLGMIVLCALGLNLVRDYERRERAAEAESHALSIVRLLEQAYGEHGVLPRDEAELCAALDRPKTCLKGYHYEKYTWSGEIKRGIFVGSVTCLSTKPEEAPEVRVELLPDATANYLHDGDLQQESRPTQPRGWPQH